MQDIIFKRSQPTLTQQSEDLNDLQQQFLKSSDSEDDFQNDIPQIKYISNSYFSKKQKPQFTTPFNKYIDKQSLKKQFKTKSDQLNKIRKINSQLKHKYSQNMLLRRQLEQALYKLSEALPTSMGSQSFFILKQKNSIETKNLKSKDQLMKLKRSSKATYKCEFEILKQHLENHTQELNRQLKSLIKKDTDKKKKVQLKPEEARIFESGLDEIQTFKNNRMITIKCNLLNQKIEQDNVSIKLKDIRIKLSTQQIKKKKQLLQQIKLQNIGLTYQQSLIQKNKQSIKQIQCQIERLKYSSQQKQKIFNDLKSSLDDKTNVYEYVIKWNEQLKQKLEQKRKAQQQIKSKLQTKINNLSKQFQQWSSKCKMLIMQDQAMKFSKKHKQYKINQKLHGTSKMRLIKEYQIQSICKRMNFELASKGVLKQHFIEFVIDKNETISIKDIYENLKKSQVVSEQYYIDLLKVSRYIIQDNEKQQILDQNNYLDVVKAKLILSSMLGAVLTPQQIEIQNQRIVQIMKKSYWNIRQKLPALQMVPQQRLRQSFIFLGSKFNMTTFKAICLILYEFDNSEIGKYSLYSFKASFEKFAIKRQETPQNQLI